MRILRKFFIDTFHLLKDTGISWFENRDIFMLSSALSYYAIFSLPGLMLIVISVAGFFFGEEAVNGRIYLELKGFLGPDGAKQVQDMIRNAYTSKTSVFATLVAIGTLVFSASGVMYQLQQSLNRIWSVRAKPKKAFLMMLRDRLFSFGMIIAFAFLLMMTLVVSSIINALTDWISLRLFSLNTAMLYIINVCITLFVDIVIFTLIYKTLPDVKLRWRDVWKGGLVTAVLFEVGKFLISFYIGKSDPGSTYGAAGAVILILLWVSYSSLILFFGAIFTRVYATYYKLTPRISEWAVIVNEDIVDDEVHTKVPPPKETPKD